MNHKFKPHQTIKVEKEKENIQLRKKIQNFTPDKRLANKKETVWDRLSKIKKVSSTENVLIAGRTRPNINAKHSQRFQPIKQSSFKQSIQTSRRPLFPSSTSANKRSTSYQRIFVNQANDLDAVDNPTFLRAVPVKEADSARSSSSESAVGFFKLSDESLHLSYQEANVSSEDSDDVYTLAPLLTSCSEDGSKTCMRTINNVRGLLRQNKSMALEDIELVKDVIKASSRCEELEKNPKFLKDILKTQLQNILMQEFAVKKALDKLESPVSLQQKQSLEPPTNKMISYSGHKKDIQKFEVDVIFKNVPSLDKEIEILRALGEKLEATLKCTTSHRTRRHDAVSQTSIIPTASSLVIAEERDTLVMLKLQYEVYDLIAEHQAEVSVYLIGIRQCVGIANEFYAAQKSLVELKHEFNRPFYIQRHSESFQLIRTSFEKLKETPDELLHHVKPKHSQVAFNVLEQDPVFFHNAFNKLSNNSCLLSTKQNYCEEHQFPIRQAFCENENSNFQNTSISNQKAPQNYTNLLIESECRSVYTPNISEPAIRLTQRRRIRRHVTPMPIDYNCCPKHSVFKTILVGFVQMSVFIVFIMALTYPDVRC